MKNTKIIYVLFFVLLIFGCNKDYEKLIITNFSETKTVTLTPKKFFPYAMLKVRIKGFCNDTIRFNNNQYGNSSYFLMGKIDTLLIQTDYYGEKPVTFIFDPYKATEGNLEIEMKL